MAEAPAGRARLGAGAAGRVAEVVMASLYVTVEQVGIVVGHMPPVQAGVATEENDDDQNPDELRRPVDSRREAERDPLVSRAKEYASGAMRVLQAIRPAIVRSRDSVALDAAERLEETCITVASKIHRAVSSFLDSDGEIDSQSDANGSAKVALLLIEESRQAWQALMRPGFAVGDGAPAGFVKTLDALESRLHERFPQALAFIRPGFDTEADGIARAILSAPVIARD